MKKKLILLLSGALLLAGCGGDNPEQKEEEHKDDPTPTPCEHVDANHDGHCDLCEAEMEVHHVDDNHDHKCDVCEAKMSDHTYEDGYCTYCGKKDPDYNLFYLPSKITSINGIEDDVIKFEYDDDLLGFKSTRYEIGFEDDLHVKTYRYSEDFSEYTFIDEDISHDEVYSGSKEVYHQLEGSSYMVTRYEYDYDLKDYVFYCEKTRLYNSNNRQILNARKSYDDDNECYVYDTYDVVEYDEAGFVTKSTEYKEFKVGDEPKEIGAYISYAYNESHTSCLEEDYYNNDGSLIRDGYAVIDIKQEDGVIKFDQQLYNEDGEKLNHNKFEYRASDWTSIYNLYGGIPQEEILAINEHNQVTAYYDRFEDNYVDVKLTYNETGNVKETEKVSGYIGNTRVQIDKAAYTYNEHNQLSKAVLDVSDKDGEVIEPAYSETVTIEFTELQNDELLSHMDYVNSIIAGYTDWAVFEGI